MRAERPELKAGGIYEWSVTFFGLVADGMRRLRERKEVGKGGLMMEMMATDGYAYMDGLRMGTVERKKEFPVMFDRIHASNVPDYV